MKIKTPSTLFINFNQEIDANLIPSQFSLMTGDEAHPLCVLAAIELQDHILNQKEWQHNFGLSENDEGIVIGKMFGVLVVQNQDNEIGYLAAFSGKLAGSNHHEKFVPPVFDTLAEDSFLNTGMEELAVMGKQIKELTTLKADHYLEKVAQLKAIRKNHSIALQNQLFEAYHFLNNAGSEKSLVDIFKEIGHKNPPAGAGECAGPKLLQYAFQNELKPLALAEFWWGLSPKSATWIHKQFYACCKEKCEPILAHMLSGIA